MEALLEDLDKIDPSDDKVMQLVGKLSKTLDPNDLSLSRYNFDSRDQPPQYEEINTLLGQKNAPVRGALKIETLTSTPVISAGKEFSIYVVIRNPFPVPVQVFSTETHIPVELSDEIWRSQRDKAEQIALIDDLKSARTFASRIGHRLYYTTRKLYRALRRDAGPRVAVAVTPENVKNITDAPQPIISLARSEIGGNIKIGNVIYRKYDIHVGNRTDEELRSLLRDLSQYERNQPPILLNSGDSIVQHFILRTTGWLLFTPIGYTFQIQIRYKVDETFHVDTVPYQLNIRAALLSSLVGAVLGSLLGTTVSAKNLNLSFTLMITKYLISIIFAFVVVVAFARKNNVQSIVSVEDFWGGLFIGFLVGYSGEDFVAKILQRQP